MIDANAVGLIGFSRTCYHVKYAIAFSKKVRFAAATAADGIDFGYWQYLVWGNGFDRLWTGDFHVKNQGSPFDRDGLASWIARSPHFNIASIRTPLRIESYGRSNALLQWDMFIALKMTGRPVEHVFFEDAAHELTQPGQREASLQGNLDWFRFWLQGYEDPAPGKGAQYQRWRAMKSARAEVSPQEAAFRR